MNEERHEERKKVRARAKEERVRGALDTNSCYEQVGCN